MAITTEELKLLIKAETASAVANLRQFDRASKSTQVGVDTLAKGFKSFGKDALGAVGAPLAVGAALTKLVGVASDSFKAFEESQKSFQKLNGAFIASGDSTGIAARNLRDYADELESALFVDDDLIVSSASLLKEITNLDEQGIKQILPSIIDMSQALGVDLETATKTVAQTIAGGKDGLKKYGIEIDKDASLTEKLDQVTKGLDSRFGGIAKTMATDGLAAFRDLGVQTNDYMKIIGEGVANALEPFAKGLATILKNANDAAAAIKAMKEVEAGKSQDYAKAISAAKERLKLAQYELEVMGFSAEMETEEIKKLKENIRMWTYAQSMKERGAKELSDAERKKMEAAAKAAEEEDAYAEKYKKVHGELANVIEGEKSDYQKIYEKIQAINSIKWKNDDKKEAADAVNILKDNLAEAEQKFIDAYDPAKKLAYAVMMMGSASPEAAIDAYERLAEAADIATESTEKLTDAQKSQNAHEATLAASTEAQTKLLEESYKNAFAAIGESMVTGQDALKLFAEATKETLAGIVDALGQRMLAEAALNLALGPAFWPQAALAGAQAAIAFTAAGAIRAIPMAQGGEGTVNQPTLFLAGEAGAEDFSFTPKNKQQNKKSGNTVINVYGSVVSERYLTQLASSSADRGY